MSFHGRCLHDFYVPFVPSTEPSNLRRLQNRKTLILCSTGGLGDLGPMRFRGTCHENQNFAPQVQGRSAHGNALGIGTVSGMAP